MDPGVILFMVVLLIVFLGMNTLARRSQQKREQSHEQMLKDRLEPGVWVQTYSGFYGRYIDTDGGVVIIETPSGEETYWAAKAIRAVEDPPFEVESETESESFTESDLDIGEQQDADRFDDKSDD